MFLVYYRRIFSEIFDGQEFVPGPDLPFDAYYSCATEVEPGIVFVSGALRGDFRDSAYMIDVDSGSVTMLPSLPHAKYYHACGVAPSPLGGVDIVAAGGDNDESVVIFNTESGAWRPGPPLPNAIEGVLYFPLHTIFPQTGNSFLYSCNCGKKKKDYIFNIGVHFFQAGYVPHDDTFLIIGGSNLVATCDLVK